MRILHEFVLQKNQQVEEKETSKNEKGEEITTSRKVDKPVDHTFIVKKPNRALYDEAELFYGVKLSEGIKAGLLTRALLAKRFNNDGGVLSDIEKDKFSNMYLSLFEKQSELQAIEMKSEKERTDEEKKRREELIDDLNKSREEVQEFEMSQASLFDQTAENRARNKTILWWVVNLSYKKVSEDKFEPVFKGDSFDEKIAEYDKYEEKEEDFWDDMLKKLSYVVSFWYITKADSKEELDVLLATSEQQDQEDQEEIDEIKTGEVEEAVEESKEENQPQKKRREKSGLNKT